MNPQFDSTPGLRLPQPSVNSGLPPTYQAPVQQPAMSQPLQYPEIQNIAPQTPQYIEPAMTLQQQAQPVQASVAVQPGQNAPQQAPVVATQVAVAPEPNEDGADEVWVEKARAIAAQYRDDPYAQSRALSKLKADYMLARYSKTLKAIEG